MIEAHEIIKQVHETFKGLPSKMARLFGKSVTWWQSHGYQLKNDNPLSNGNLSAVDHFFEFVEQYEAAAPGAGKMLIERVYAELIFRLCDNDFENAAQNDLRRDLLKEAVEAVCVLDEKCVKQMSLVDLRRADAELADLADKNNDARAFIRVERKLKESGIKAVK